MTLDAQRVRPKVPRAIWWLLAGLGVVLVAGWVYGIAHFDDDLTERSRAALRDANIPVDVHFDGRHGYLTGSLEYEDDVAEAVAVVREVRGVADVSAEIEFSLAGGPPRLDPPPTAAPTTSPELTFRVQDGVILLTGRVASQDELDTIVVAAEAAFGADNVINELSVRSGLESPDWIARLPNVMTSLTDLPAGAVAFGPEGASVSGTVDTEALRTAIGDAVAAAVAPLALNNRIVVVVVQEPSFVASGTDGAVTLRGQMPDRVAIDRIVAAAEGIYGTGNVIDELVTGPGVTTAEWLDVVPGLFVHTAGLDPWEITIVEGTLVVSGRGPADGSVQSAIEAFATVGGGLSVDTGGLEVASEAVAEELTDLLEGSATFESGSATLSADATDLLDRAIALLLANPSTVLVVEGHTDDQGAEAANLSLSQARADAVVAYLVAGGIAPDRLTAIGYGELRPIAPNDSVEGRATNRRIEFIVEEGTN